MSQSLLAEALAAGASIVTPNNRLAREIATRFDAARRAEGKRAWIPAQAMPWTMWLDRLWLAALAAPTSAGRVLVDASATRELWHTIIAADRRELLNPRGAARHAVDAWALFHGWRHAAETRPSEAMHGGDDDAQLFAAWAVRYRERLDALGGIDQAQLPDVLATCAASAWTQSIGRVVLHGFIAFTPQQQRLIGALRATGVDIGEIPVVPRGASAGHRTACPTSSDELTQALGFARARLLADPNKRIAIVVADLHERRSEAIARAEELLCPEQLLSLVPDAARPYGVSLGEPLASVPVIACALDFIALSIGDVEAATASSAVRAPFLPDAAAQWTRRGQVERRWREEGRRHVTWADLLFALRPCDPILYQRFSPLAPPARAPRLPRDWARTWSDWLAALGWPGDAPLTSAQWQARDAWSNALAKFASSGMITGAMTGAVALQTLRALLAETLWAPEAAPAPVQILGILEAAGLSFDCAWLAGFDAHRWPPSASPNPFLPLAWQHARGVTRAHPETALTHAQHLTMQLGALATEVIVSHAERVDDAPSAISPLFAHWPRLDPSALPGSLRLSDTTLPVALERTVDLTAPPLAAGASIRGGASLFQSQSDCPFQACARYRLRADAWAPCPEGLSAGERGIVLHAVLKAFWDDVQDHATLANLDVLALEIRIADAVAQGKSKLPPARWRALPPAVASAEMHRLAATLRAWLDEGERVRPPFRVRGHEQAVDCDLEGVAVRVRVDRIDELDSGGLAIIDYKSGRVVKPARWFAPRPEGVQLALYAHGLDRIGGAPVRALAYAQVKAGDIAVSGLAESDSVWPALEVAGGERSRLPLTGWDDARSKMRDGLVLLAREIRDGAARVAPRDGGTCQYCGRKALCRIRVLDDQANAPDGATPDE